MCWFIAVTRVHTCRFSVVLGDDGRTAFEIETDGFHRRIRVAINQSLNCTAASSSINIYYFFRSCVFFSDRLIRLFYFSSLSRASVAISRFDNTVRLKGMRLFFRIAITPCTQRFYIISDRLIDFSRPPDDY